MKTKRILSCILAVAMLLTVCSTMVFAADTVTVTFDDNNGYTSSVEVESGVTLHELPLPDDAGTKVFIGWFADRDCTEPFDINTTITEPTTIYAGWLDLMNFRDVTDETELYEAIAYVYYTGIMNGVDKDSFAPKSPLTRAMIVTILHRMEGEPVVNYAMPFSDVPANEYYTEAVRWAAAEKIVEGTSATTFTPNENVSREQMAAILYRYATRKGIDLDALSADTNTMDAEDIMNVAEYAKTAMHCCLATDAILLRGKKIEPASPATRAEAAQAIMTIAILRDMETGEIFLPDDLKYTYEELAGDYEDMNSLRATLHAEATEDDGLKIRISWGNSSSETIEWTMNAEYDIYGNLVYKNGVQKKITTGAGGKSDVTTISQNGKGFFTVAYGMLLWNGAEIPANRDCCFVPDYIMELYDAQRNGEESEPVIGMPNPVVATDAKGIMEKLGFEFKVPKDAKNVKYSIISDKIAQMDFTLDGMDFTARIGQEEGPEIMSDISGMYYKWDTEEDCKVAHCAGKVMRAIADGKTHDVCIWHDVVPGLVYSVSVSAPDLDGFDITAIAEAVFSPAQGNVG